MPKRKRDSESAEAEGPQEAPRGIQAMRAEQKVVHGQKLLNRAFKTAKGFERQKLGRRRKTAIAESKTGDIARIDAEIEALKALDASAAANNYLNKCLLKVKAVAQSPSLPKVVTTTGPQIGDAAVLNVIARLCNSNPVKEALPAVLQDIQRALGIQDTGGAKAVQKRVREKKDGTISRVSKQKSDEEDLLNAADDRLPDEGDDSDEFAGFSARIANSSDSDDDQASASDNEHALQKGHISRAAALRAAVPSLSPSPSPSPSPEPPSRRKAPSAAPPRPTSSAFVPSLTMGGYWSGSESEPEDADDLDLLAPKKNRRGQRARQAIAAQKYGAKAKHLANAPAPQDGDRAARDQGWDPKRGATATDARGGHRGRGSGTRGGGRGGGGYGRARDAGAGTASAGRDAPPKKHKDNEGPLHPSWEAAKKAKEAKATAPFQGKKITFD